MPNKGNIFAKKTMKKILLSICATGLLFAACNNAAETKEETVADTTAPVVEAAQPPMDSAAMMKACMDNMTPGDMHKMMATWAGKWDEQLSFWMKPDAQPETHTATSENKMIFNGLYQQSTHKGDMNGMPFEGMGTMAYDNVRKVFVSTWIDNMGSGIMHMEGTWDDASKTLTMKGKMSDPMSGGEVDVRETIKVVDDNNHVMEMYMTQGGKEFKSMEIKMTRKV